MELRKYPYLTQFGQKRTVRVFSQFPYLESPLYLILEVYCRPSVFTLSTNYRTPLAVTQKPSWSHASHQLTITTMRPFLHCATRTGQRTFRTSQKSTKIQKMPYCDSTRMKLKSSKKCWTVRVLPHKFRVKNTNRKDSFFLRIMTFDPKN